MGSWMGNSIGLQAVFHHFYTIQEICAGDIHLVDIGHTGYCIRSAWRHTVSDCGSTPPFAENTATAPSSTRRERSTSTVKSTCPGVSMMLIRYPFQWAVVAADVMVMPRSLLLSHPVHRSCAVMYFTYFVNTALYKKDTFRRRGFTGIDVGHDTNVSRFFQGKFSCHFFHSLS
jgi:hypothetical protein